MLEPVLGRRRDRVERRPTPQIEQAAPSGAARASGTACSSVQLRQLRHSRYEAQPVREGPAFGTGATVFAF